MAERVDFIEDNPKTSYEPKDWPIGRIGLIFLGTFLFLVIAPLALILAFPTATSDTGRKLSAEPPAPQLQVDPQLDLEGFRAAQEERLNNYYWIDKQKGIVHIPIDQAMEKLAKDGIGGFPKGRQ